MSIKRKIAEIWAAQIRKSIEQEAASAVIIQQKVLRSLVQKAKNTRFGIAHDFNRVLDVASFQENVPVRDYEMAKEFFDLIYKGVENVSWPGKPLYLAKTSGTTSGAKYIPITRESIRFQIKAARDSLLLYIAESKKSDFLDGKMMFLSGSPVLETNEFGMQVGRLSGIVNHFVPAYLQKNRIPSAFTNSIEDWDEKIERILDEAIDSDLRLISGIPPWVQMFFERLLVRTGKMPLEQWKNLQVFVHGGVDFHPYKTIFNKYFNSQVDIIELFPASEGFFAFQDQHPDKGLLLNVNAGIFYEFIHLDEYFKPDPKRLWLGNVQIGIQYVLIISSNAGLWAYDIGDVVTFVSITPFRLKVSGRVKHFISAFGEHVIAEEVNRAMVEACKICNASVNEFSVAPFVSDIKGDSFHEWFVEFSQMPEDFARFSFILDEKMQDANLYYHDLRIGGLLKSAQIRKIKLNACREYMKSQGKLGGQNKFPRLANNREIAGFLENYQID